MAELSRVTVWAEALIRVHLEPLYGEGTWTFRFDRAKRRAGMCNYATKCISVSRYLAAKYEDDEIHQILLHEIAHGIVGLQAGHGPEWKRIAREIGYVGESTHDGEIAHELAPWRGVCPAGHEHARFRRPTRETSCAKCSRRFSREHLITWKEAAAYSGSS